MLQSTSASCLSAEMAAGAALSDGPSPNSARACLPSTPTGPSQGGSPTPPPAFPLPTLVRVQKRLRDKGTWIARTR